MPVVVVFVFHTAVCWFKVGVFTLRARGAHELNRINRPWFTGVISPKPNNCLISILERFVCLSFLLNNMYWGIMSQIVYKIGSSLWLAVNKYWLATNDAGEIVLFSWGPEWDTLGIFKWTTWNSKCTQCFFWPLFCTRKTGLLGIKDRCGVSLVANLLTYGFAGDGPTFHLPDVLHLLLHLLFLHQRLKILLHGPLLNLDARYFVKHARTLQWDMTSIISYRMWQKKHYRIQIK